MIVRTVQGDVSPEALGLVLGHEHLIARPPAFVTDDDLRLDDEDAAVRELGSFREVGGGGVVEMTTVDYGRDIDALDRVARASGVLVIAATGFNKGRFADGLVARHSDEALVAWMVSEVRQGCLPYQAPERARLEPRSRTDAGDPGARSAGDAPSDQAPERGASDPASPGRAGLIKASTGADGPGAQEGRVLEAAAAAHAATGAPVGTHTERGAWALEQAQFLTGKGVAPGKILIGHCDFRPELAYLSELAATGVNVGFDQFSKEKYLPDATRVELLTALASEGYLERLIVSGDLARRSYWPAYTSAEAPGLTHVPTAVASMLRAEGWSDADLAMLMQQNPQRWLAFEPR